MLDWDAILGGFWEISDSPLPSPWLFSLSSDSILSFFLIGDFGFSSLPSGIDVSPFLLELGKTAELPIFLPKESDFELVLVDPGRIHGLSENLSIIHLIFLCGNISFPQSS
jgi:hypothetical protein